MISSSSPPLERALDTIVLVYSLLKGHPAETACERLLRSHTGWFTSPLVLFEAKGILTRVYGEDPVLVTRKLAQVASGSHRRRSAASGAQPWGSFPGQR
jgi:predicted nucleic acid-binding protein